MKHWGFFIYKKNPIVETTGVYLCFNKKTSLKSFFEVLYPLLANISPIKT